MRKREALRWVALLILSPTRAAADVVKGRRPERATHFIRSWNHAALGLAVAVCGALYLVPPGAVRSVLPLWAVLLYLWLAPSSRCNEILVGFLSDALDRVRGVEPRTAFSTADRLGLAFTSYLEVALNFGILYYAMPGAWFSRRFATIVEAVYFSGVTITTVGYGDVTPTGPASQLLALYEVLIGLVLVVLTVGTYVGLVSREAGRQ